MDCSVVDVNSVEDTVVSTGLVSVEETETTSVVEVAVVVLVPQALNNREKRTTNTIKVFFKLTSLNLLFIY